MTGMAMKDRALPPPAIVGIGCAVPRHEYRQDEIAEFMIAAHGMSGREARRLRELYRLTRIERRHSVVPDYSVARPAFRLFPPGVRAESPPSTATRMNVFREESLPLAIAASRQALADASGVMPGDIGHLFVVSCTGAFAPGLDGYLVEALGLRPDIGRTMVGFQGCHAGLSALQLAAHVTSARPASASLIVCVELSTLHFQLDPTDENLLANALFADGAAAAVLAGDRLLPPANHDRARFRLLDTRTMLRPEGRGLMVWSVGDSGFTLHLSGLLPRMVATDLRMTLEPLAAANGSLFWAVHPGGTAILEAVEKSLELSPASLQVSRDVLRRYGNMSSPTIFFVLREMLRNPDVHGEGIALAFGPGLTVEAARLVKE